MAVGVKMYTYLVGLIALVAAMSEFVTAAAPVDPVTNYAVVYVTGVNGGAHEAFVCRSPNTCTPKLKVFVCPDACPLRDIQGPGNTACFMNCATCTIACKHRKVGCNGYGAVCYDPRFVGGDGVMFYFHGQKDQDFCIVSDKNLHINAHFIGKRPQGRSRDYTWVQGLGMLFDSHRLSVSAKKVATWSDEIDQLIFSFDGQDVILPELQGSLWTSPSGKMVIERTANVNSIHLVIDQLMEVSLDVVPITAEDSRVHNYQIAKDDCFAHLHMHFNFFHLSDSVNGVLGQTYQPHFKNPVKVGVPMPIMGGDEKFRSSSLFSSDCKVTQFSTADAVVSANSLLSSFPIHCNNINGRGLACRR